MIDFIFIVLPSNIHFPEIPLDNWTAEGIEWAGCFVFPIPEQKKNKTHDQKSNTDLYLDPTN